MTSTVIDGWVMPSMTARSVIRRGGSLKLQRQSLDRGLLEWIELWNESARPFKWAMTPDQIIDRICRYCSRISEPAH